MPPAEKKLSPFEVRLNELVGQVLRHVPFVQKMLVIQNLHIMIRAGLSIVAALRVLVDQIEHPYLKKVVAAVAGEVEKGKQLSEALAQYPRIFPAIYVSMIAAGETSGKMEEALEQVGTQMKKSNQLSSRIRGAMMYPAVIIVAMVGIGIEMTVFVLPKVLTMFEDVSVELPLPTRILLGTMNFFEHYGILAAVGAAAAVGGIVMAMRQYKVKRVAHLIFLRLPVAGKIIKQINIARFTLTLSSLLGSSIPIVEAVRVSSSVQGNIRYREALEEVSERLKKGEVLSAGLTEFPRLFPPMVTGMVRVGEEAGEAEEMLKKLAEYYGEEVDNTMRNFSTIIEPVLILLMGVSVAGLAAAVIMPMYSLAQNY